MDTLHVLFSDEGHPVAIRKWSQEPFDDAVEYVRKSDLADLIAACDAALDWADANARWFDISTAPDEEGVSFLVTTEVRSHLRSWIETHVVHLNEDGEIHPDCHQGWSLRDYTHWRPLPPPPSNPPLPAPLEALGAVLRKVKGTT